VSRARTRRSGVLLAAALLLAAAPRASAQAGTPPGPHEHHSHATLGESGSGGGELPKTDVPNGGPVATKGTHKLPHLGKGAPGTLKLEHHAGGPGSGTGTGTGGGGTGTGSGAGGTTRGTTGAGTSGAAPGAALNGAALSAGNTVAADSPEGAPCAAGNAATPHAVSVCLLLRITVDEGRTTGTFTVAPWPDEGGGPTDPNCRVLLVAVVPQAACADPARLAAHLAESWLAIAK